MPKFLSRAELYRMIQRELPPEDVYPDGAPSAFFSTADSDSTAKALESLYGTLARIYANIFPQSADENQADWEVKVLGSRLSGDLTLQQRRERVLARIRSQRRMRISDIITATLGVIGFDKEVEVAEWGTSAGSWMLGLSQLGVETILGMGNPYVNVGPELCGKTAADLGLTDSELTDLQDQAYTYEVRIYNYTLTTAERTELDATLDAAEPARSTHVIRDGLTDADKLNGDT